MKPRTMVTIGVLLVVGVYLNAALLLVLVLFAAGPAESNQRVDWAETTRLSEDAYCFMDEDAMTVAMVAAQSEEVGPQIARLTASNRVLRANAGDVVRVLRRDEKRQFVELSNGTAAGKKCWLVETKELRPQ